LPDKGASWGSYYTCDPRILAGPVAPAFARLQSYLPIEHNTGLEHLFSDLHLSTVGAVQ
jgi:hypothetical protein